MLKWSLRCTNLILSLLILFGVVWISSVGFLSIPPLGSAFNPETGIWSSAKRIEIENENMSFKGLKDDVTVKFDGKGVPSIEAKSDEDLFFAIGYLQSRNRLFQMDLMRRQGKGQLSEIIGEGALSNDTFQLQLGIQRIAEMNWGKMNENDPEKEALIHFTEGVNQYIADASKSGELPLLFKVFGYKPQKWTPVDSLVIQGVLAQKLSFSTKPLDYALLVESMGYEKTMEWFPLYAPNKQFPYDTTFYKEKEEIQTGMNRIMNDEELLSVKVIKDSIADMLINPVHQYSNSNSWAVSGLKSTTGKPIMAGDPHLDLTLPSIWYQFTASSTNYNFSGVSVPGLPIILIGQNKNISWSLTNVQNQGTYYYKEKLDPDNPGKYYWNGKWNDINYETYEIKIKGQSDPQKLVVESTVHGPIINKMGQTMSVFWTGTVPSNNIKAMLEVSKSKNFDEFNNALANWNTPTQNFVYSDIDGNIGMLGAGYYPIIKEGIPWLPLSGTGESDIVSKIPFSEIPRVYNPPSQFVFSANQRPVDDSYPYYIGTTISSYDNGYRAARIHQFLNEDKKYSVEDMISLQNDTKDYLASLIVPKVLAALQDESLDESENRMKDLLTSWNYNMGEDSSAATIWWMFWTEYLTETFQPWWDHYKVPVEMDEYLKVGPWLSSLVENLEHWTLNDPENHTFSLPDGKRRDSVKVIQAAFHKVSKMILEQYGTDEKSWQWGNIHSRKINSLTYIPSLSYGPSPSVGNPWTVNAANGGLTSSSGPSWRYIVDWAVPQDSIGVYPGGQSENPLSSLYDDQITKWWQGEYFPIIDKSDQNPKTWVLKPKG
jgi:penicillin amidase